MKTHKWKMIDPDRYQLLKYGFYRTNYGFVKEINEDNVHVANIFIIDSEIYFNIMHVYPHDPYDRYGIDDKFIIQNLINHGLIELEGVEDDD